MGESVTVSYNATLAYIIANAPLNAFDARVLLDHVIELGMVSENVANNSAFDDYDESLSGATNSERDFDVFEVANDWDVFKPETWPKPVNNRLFQKPQLQGECKLNLRKVVMAINHIAGKELVVQPPNPDSESDVVVDRSMAKPYRGGRPESSVVSELKIVLGAYLHANGLPEGNVKAPSSLVNWCQSYCEKKGLTEPKASSTIDKLVGDVLLAHREALGSNPKT